MKKTPSPFLIGWRNHIFRGDKISLPFIALSIIIAAAWGYLAEDKATLVYPLGLLALAIAFSFFSYVFLGIPRTALSNKFYDAIYSACGFSPSYRGREKSRIKVLWKGIEAQQVTVRLDTASHVTTSSKEWRNVKMAASDTLGLGKKTYAVDFTEHTQGILNLKLVKEGDADSTRLLETEFLYSFVYDALSRHGFPLPKITGLVLDGQNSPSELSIALRHTVERYNKSSFEKNFAEKYDRDFISIFDWSADGVSISRINKGSQEERKFYSEKSLADLVHSSFNSAFLRSDSDAYHFDSKRVQWNEDVSRPEEVIIDFGHADISRPEDIERFEKLFGQGLRQLFRTNSWNFGWNISASEKFLVITPKQTPVMREIETRVEAIRTEQPRIDSSVVPEETVSPPVALIARPSVAQPVRPRLPVPPKPSKPTFPSRPSKP